ncbi:MAG: DUF5916 domain-containing protein [Fimbriimonadaceae bacterium]
MRLLFTLPMVLCVTSVVSKDESKKDPYELPAVKIATKPKIDGNVTPEEWGGIPSGSGFFDSRTGQPTEGGTFWIAYDDKFIYFAAKLDAKDPKSLKATEYRSNVSLRSDDAVFLAVDVFGSLTNFNTFGINPRGATDIRIAGGRAAKREWLGEFLANGRITETGYEVEAQIPWGVMRLPESGKRNARIQVVRYDSKTQRQGDWRFTNSESSLIPTWTNVDLPKSGNGRSIKLLPFGYGGINKVNTIANAGLDLKTSISDRIDLVGTINPDFRNIENQVLSLDFSYFERLAGESRPFFLEGGQYFSTSMDAPLFAPQRINKFDFGVKTFGQVGDKSDFAMLDTVDIGVRNSFAGILKHKFSPFTSATFGMTSLTGNDTNDNTATYAAVGHQVGNWNLFGQHMLTRDTALGNGSRFNTGGFYSKNGLVSVLEYQQVSPQFLPRLGFAPERNYKGFAFSIDKTRTIPTGAVMETEFALSGQDYRTYDGNAPYRSGLTGVASATLRDGTDIDVAYSYEKFFGSHDRTLFLSVEKPRGDRYRHWQVDAIFGDISGEPYRSVRGLVSYRPAWNWQVDFSLQDVRHFTNTTQSILSTVYDIGRDMSISGRMVRTGSDTNAYMAFRKSGSKGAEYFVILGDPNARKFQAALVLKAVFPMEIRF